MTGATEDYRSSEDIFGRFVTDCCIVGKAFAVRFSLLYERLEQWGNDAGEYVPKKRAVGTWLEDSGYEKYSANGRHYRGLMLRNIEQSDDSEDSFMERTE